MSKLSLSQQYLLLAANPELTRLFPLVKQVMQTYACGAGLVSLLQSGGVRLRENGQLETADASKAASPGTRLLMEQLASAKSPTVRSWVHDVYAHRKVRVPVCQQELEPLAATGQLRIERRKALLLFPVERHIPQQEIVTSIVEQLRAGLLAEAEPDHGIAHFAMLLDASKLLSACFPQQELQAARARLRALEERHSGQWNLFRQTRRIIDEIHLVIVTHGGI